MLLGILFYAIFPFYLFLLLFVIGLLNLFLIIRFFRYPNRAIKNTQNNVVYSAADGVVVAVEDIYDSTFETEKYIQVSVFMSLFNVHLNWLPVNGMITDIKYLKGKYLVAKNPKSSMENEMLCTMIESECGHKLIVKQIAGFIARRIVGFQSKGSRVKAGDELGFIKFGSRVDLLLPLSASVKVKIGDKVKGLETIIATLHDKNKKD